MNTFDFTAIRRDFPALQQQVYGKPLIYLDSAATAQKPQCVIDTVNDMHARWNANIHRAVHYLATQCTERYEQARETVRRFIHARATQEVVFTSGTTAAINLLAFSFGERRIGAGDEIIVTEAEHHSNIVPWQLLCERKGATLKVVPVDPAGRLQMDSLAALINERTRLLCVAHISNVLGIVNPVKELVRLAHTHGVPVLLDGAQGVVHQPVDVQDMDCDFYVFSGHKLFAPTGIGVLYGRETLLEQLPPWQGGGDMIASVSFAKTSFADLPLKFEAGTANYIGACGLATAIDYLQAIPLAAAHRYEQELTAYTVRRLSTIEGLQVYGEKAPKTGVVSFTIAGVHPLDMATILDKSGVALRTGHLCAEPLMRRFGVSGMLRVSPAFYNTPEEIDTFVAALKTAKKMLVGN
ncbi:MAG: cysteine desulfurase [Prevotellaceae bacterium]|jgi:cysteine desulfurase/selenocysteine lyase|nr:cysteine desulfurase [Prevotellaceae bacterium]